MKRTLVAILALNCLAAFGAETPAADAGTAAPPASPASIKELLDVTNARSLVDNMWGQIERYTNASLRRTLQNKELTPAQQKEFTVLNEKILDSLKKELNWEKLEPLYYEIYSKSFTDEEIKGMIDFYKTPAGQAVLRKMPVVLRETMTAMQERLGPTMARVQETIKEEAAKIEAEGSASPKAPNQ